MSWVAAGAGAVLLTMLGFVIRISYQVGRLVQRLDDHITTSDAAHADQESRLRVVEQRARPGRA